MTNATTGSDQRRTDVRHIGDVPGVFLLLDRPGPAFETQAFRFSARSVSTSRAVVTTDMVTVSGEEVALRFDDIGIRRGRIDRVLKDGFIVVFTAAGDQPEGHDARIGWLNRKTRERAEDRRRHKRVPPRNADAVLILGADSRVPCRIIDMSRSGVAIRCDAQAPIGQLVAVGAVAGRVVRYLPDGIAIQFLELQDLAVLEGLMTLRSRDEKKMAARRLGHAA